MPVTFDPQIGAASQLSPNPGGRPHKTADTDAIREQLAQVDEKDRAGRTNAEIVAAPLVARAKKGDVRAASEIADRAEGRPSQSLNLQGRMEVSNGSDPVHHGIFSDPREARDRDAAERYL
jgi:hypothetical protein